jgi:hypothetical protein
LFHLLDLWTTKGKQTQHLKKTELTDVPTQRNKKITRVKIHQKQKQKQKRNIEIHEDQVHQPVQSTSDELIKWCDVQ